MGLKVLLHRVHSALESAQIPHALIGGLALAFWGVQRATADVDFLAPAEQREELKKVILALGFSVYHESPDVLQFIGIGSLDFILAQRPLSKKMLENAKILPNSTLRCLLAEDLIGLKIQAYKNDPRRALQDKADIQALLRKNPTLDKARVQSYAVLFEEWEEIQNLWKMI